jgi:adenylate cyclase
MASEEARAPELAVLMHADVVGSTKLVTKSEAIAHTRITDAFSRLSACRHNYAATVHEFGGDALLAEMRRASDAVAAAIAVQVSNTEERQRYDDGIAPEIRAGVSLSDVISADNTVTGPGIVLAQRIEQLATPSGVCVTGGNKICRSKTQPLSREASTLSEQRG